MPLDTTSSGRTTVRSTDQDGRLHVKVSHISKAAVNPYQGREIPQWQQLGLDPDRIYMLLRDPEELKKAAPTFNNLQLLDKHIPVSSAEPKQEHTVGSTGTDAAFDGVYLNNSLVIWKDSAIAGVETDQIKELSSAYHYSPDMTPGVFNGDRYDGVMRNIRGNHLCLVEDGRAGNDVVVMDAALKIEEPEYLATEFLTQDFSMSAIELSPRGRRVADALSGYFTPLMKKGHAVPAMDAMLSGIQQAPWSKLKPVIAANAVKVAKPHLAMDASLESLAALLDHFDSPAASSLAAPADTFVESEGGFGPSDSPQGGGAPEVPFGDPENTNEALAGKGEGEDADPLADPADAPPAPDDDLEMKIRELLTGKLDDADLGMLLKLIQPQAPAAIDPDPAPPVAPDPSSEADAGPKRPGDVGNMTDDPADPEKKRPPVKPPFAKDEVPESLTQMKGPSMQPAMDAAIRAASARAAEEAVKRTTDKLNARTQAERFVRPWVGEIAVAMDAAEDVYRFALKQMGVETKGVHPSAYRTMLSLVSRPGEVSNARPAKVAMDAAGSKTYLEMFPGAKRARVVA